MACFVKLSVHACIFMYVHVAPIYGDEHRGMCFDCLATEKIWREGIWLQAADWRTPCLAILIVYCYSVRITTCCQNNSSKVDPALTCI